MKRKETHERETYKRKYKVLLSEYAMHQWYQIIYTVCAIEVKPSSWHKLEQKKIKHCFNI